MHRENNSSSRMAGLIKSAIGGAISLIILSWITGGNTPSSRGGPFLLILLGLPLVVTLMGLLEFISGRPFREFSETWNTISGWKRGVLGIFIVIFSTGIMFAMIVMFA